MFRHKNGKGVVISVAATDPDDYIVFAAAFFRKSDETFG